LVNDVNFDLLVVGLAHPAGSACALSVCLFFGKRTTLILATELKPMTTGKRFRALVNDGQNNVTVMLATQLAEAAEAGTYRAGTIIRASELTLNYVQGRKCVCFHFALEPVAHMDWGLHK
jgi:hypothetical protein